ncbi:MAG: hypothetical protein K2L19_08925 [Eubacterium sp.]|nr:hypothetical protein [Eubacterium sp.]
MDGCSLNLTISALACAIAKGKTNDELTILSVFFNQLGDAIETIQAGNEICCKNNNGSNNNDTLNIT